MHIRFPEVAQSGGKASRDGRVNKEKSHDLHDTNALAAMIAEKEAHCRGAAHTRSADSSPEHGECTSAGRARWSVNTARPELTMNDTSPPEMDTEASEHQGPVDEAGWLLGDYGELDLPDVWPEEDLIGCFHLAKEGYRMWDYIPRTQATAALQAVPQNWNNCEVDETTYER